MPNVPIVENPRRRKSRRRRTLTAAQKRAGFGGKAAMTRNRSGRKSKSRRRNPSLMSLSNPKKRTRVVHVVKRNARRRRYRNPAFAGLDVQSALWVGGGLAWTDMAPGLISKVWPGVPRTGLMGHLVKAGAAVGGGMAVKMLTKNTARANQFMTGGLAWVLFGLYREFIAPKLGLSGLGSMRGYVPASEIRRITQGNGAGGRLVNSVPAYGRQARARMSMGF